MIQRMRSQLGKMKWYAGLTTCDARKKKAVRCDKGLPVQSSAEANEEQGEERRARGEEGRAGVWSLD
ncbi:uncharacterized protein J7T54_005486 [Emericellopsis cladophorae]|uniref:Uncharacterized protein n=1 Tax=Emericellopsis cladophorae TaxID=2686198 RepID=A0A9Q0BFG7_9HYPO|nr:uncharacterized protein J7T54_005486 [Emericellopsis cladophorae]KAI6783457.1 hypothetical protein J7T54_005486 [Emericellopsis cladophorae]